MCLHFLLFLNSFTKEQKKGELDKPVLLYF